MIGVRETNDSNGVFIKRSESLPALTKALSLASDSTTSSSSENNMVSNIVDKENYPYDENTKPLSSKSSPSSQKSTSPLRTINNDATNQSIVEQQFRQTGQRISNAMDQNLYRDIYPVPRVVVEDYHQHHQQQNYYSFPRHSLFDTITADDEEDFSFWGDHKEEGRMAPGVLAEGTTYTVKQTIVQGYLEKKGSGFDWLGSRAWKRRWAVLVTARTNGHDVDVPLLQIFWDYHSSSPSTVISLDSAVVLPENKLLDTVDGSNEPEKTTHPYRFKIQHLKKSVNPEIAAEVQLSRILGCSEAKERDDWVYAINAALLQYEKDKANAKELKRRSSLTPPRPPRASFLDDVVPPSPRRNEKPRTMSSPPRIPHYSRIDPRVLSELEN